MKKRCLSLMLVTVMCLVLSLCPITTEAANKTLWDAKGIKWDLEPGKTVTYYTYMGGGGYIKQKATLTCVSSEWADSSHETIKMILRVDFKRAIKPSKAKIKKVADYYKKHKKLSKEPRCSYYVVDENSGQCLMNSNDKGVYVSRGKWTKSNSKTFKSGGKKITWTNSQAEFEVTFPKSYTGLCIGIGGWTRLSETSSDKKFWAGEIPFWESKGKYTTKKSGVTHFVKASNNNK